MLTHLIFLLAYKSSKLPNFIFQVWFLRVKLNYLVLYLLGFLLYPTCQLLDLSLILMSPTFPFLYVHLIYIISRAELTSIKNYFVLLEPGKFPTSKTKNFDQLSKS